jgi:hypothetical protein
MVPDPDPDPAIFVMTFKTPTKKFKTVGITAFLTILA